MKWCVFYLTFKSTQPTLKSEQTTIMQLATNGSFLFSLNTCINARPLSFILDMHTLSCTLTPFLYTIPIREVYIKKTVKCISSELGFLCSSSCIWAVSGSCMSLNGVCLFQALGVDSLLLMQWERSRGTAGWAKTAAASHRMTDWIYSILHSNNTASAALGVCRTVAFVMLFCVQDHITNLKNSSALFSYSMHVELLLHFSSVSSESVLKCLLCPLFSYIFKEWFEDCLVEIQDEFFFLKCTTFVLTVLHSL